MTKNKSLNVELQKGVDGNYDAKFVVSSTAPDRMGDTFSKESLQKLTSTNKLVALWQHNSNQPCGYWENFKMVGNKLVASLKLADTNLGKMIRSLLDSDVPLASSVGFRIVDAVENSTNGLKFLDVDLMEISVVSTPANPQAVLLAKSYGFDDSIFTPSKESASGLLTAGKSEALNKVNNSIMRIQSWQLSQKK